MMRHFASSLVVASSLWVGCSSTAATGPTAEPEGGAPVGDAAPVQDGRISRAAIAPSEGAQGIVAAADRTADDRESDERRRPAELLTFLSVEPGMKVADLAAGGGYTTELLVRSVGPEGTVFAQNNAYSLERFVKESWPQRLEREVMRGVVRVDAEYDAPLPPEATGLDLVTIVFSYHDVIAQGHEPAVLNAAVFAALAPGGRYVVIDHSAVAGTPASEAKTLHRIDEAIVVEQVMAAGFERGRTSDFLRDPSDDLNAVSYKVGFRTDRFVLEFIKPGG